MSRVLVPTSIMLFVLVNSYMR